MKGKTEKVITFAVPVRGSMSETNL
jgi:hypothetical protein